MQQQVLCENVFFSLYETTDGGTSGRIRCILVLSTWYKKIGLDMSVLLLTFSSVKKALSILYDEERIKKEKKQSVHAITSRCLTSLRTDSRRGQKRIIVMIKVVLTIMEVMIHIFLFPTPLFAVFYAFRCCHVPRSPSMYLAASTLFAEPIEVSGNKATIC